MRSLLIAFAAVLFSSMLVGCSGGDRPTVSDNATVTDVADESAQDDDGGTRRVDLCDTDRVGCPCYNEGASFDCGRVHRHSGTYETCTEGSSTCHDGVWGPCEGTHVVGTN